VGQLPAVFRFQVAVFTRMKLHENKRVCSVGYPDIIQQFLESLVIRIMIFPIAEVTNITGFIDVFRPGQVAVQDS
jgi:hypothetical protein